MTIVSVFGIIIGLLAIPFFSRGTYQRQALALALVIVHVAAAEFYYLYTQSNRADAYTYYHADNVWRSFPWTSLGMAFTAHVTQFFKHDLGATYLDSFMIFQAFGLWGIMILMRIFQEIAIKTQTTESVLPLYFLFLPSLHFWTTAIGKDAPMFMAVTLFIWALFNFRRRLSALVISMLIMVAFRAHIGLAAGIALSIAFVFDREMSAGKKIFFLSISLVALVYLAASVHNTFDVDLTDPSSMSKFMQVREASEASDISSTALGSSFVWRWFGLLFRPFFIDAKNAFGLVASVENVGSVLLIGYLLTHVRDIRKLGKHVLVIRFSAIFSIILIFLLSLMNYNVGLGLRERVMAYPSLFVLFVAVAAFRHSSVARVRPAAARPAVSTARSSA